MKRAIGTFETTPDDGEELHSEPDANGDGQEEIRADRSGSGEGGFKHLWLVRPVVVSWSVGHLADWMVGWLEHDDDESVRKVRLEVLCCVDCGR